MKLLLVKLKEKIKYNIWFKRIIFALIGGILGYSYYFFIGCYSGACPITSNPYISVLYGLIVGLLIPVRSIKN